MKIPGFQIHTKNLAKEMKSIKLFLSTFKGENHKKVVGSQNQTFEGKQKSNEMKREF
jgi:hypothetical protein